MTPVPASIHAPQFRTCPLGELSLESGARVPDVRMTCITHGTLNADGSNAVLSLHGLRGNRHSQSIWVGPKRAFDPGRYFIVQPDTLGVASLDPDATTSPTRSGMNMSFPRFTIRDMVNAEYRMLTECLGVNRLVAVTGTSMGGIAAMQWAVSFPGFMEAVIPLLPQARANRQGNFIWEAARQAIMLDPKWRGGDYPVDDPPTRGTGIGISIQNAFGYSAAGFEEQFASMDAVHGFYQQSVEEIGRHIQARDWIYRTWAIESHDIARTPGFEGDLVATARSMRARLLLLPNGYDQLLPPGESGLTTVADHAPQARIVDIDDPGGHSGGPKSARGFVTITREIRDLLRRIAEGRPGFGAPRSGKAIG